MVTKNLLYASLLALSVGCLDKEIEEEHKKRQRLLEKQQILLKERQKALGGLCEATYNLTMKVATATHSEEMRGLLNSKEWCKVQDRYESDQRDLTIIADDGARIYCKTLRLKADRLVAANERPLPSMNFKYMFHCEGGYSDVLDQAFDLQRIINSYKK